MAISGFRDMSPANLENPYDRYFTKMKNPITTGGISHGNISIYTDRLLVFIDPQDEVLSFQRPNGKAHLPPGGF